MERRRAELIVDRLLEDLEQRLPVEFDSLLRDVWIDLVQVGAVEDLEPPPLNVTIWH